MLETFHPTTIVESPQEIITTQYIQNEITRARNSLLRTWHNEGRRPRSFEPEFDRVCYETLNKFRETNYEGYIEVRTHLDNYTSLNLETTVGERLNATLSQWEYDIEKDGIYAQGTGERAIEMFKRGRDFKRKNGNAIDFAREDAELVGFYKIEKEIIDSISQNPLTGKNDIGIEEGTMWVSFSHRGDVENGSTYPHNFYDIHTVKSKEGRKYLESRRYASALNPEDSFLKMLRFYDFPDNFSPTPEYFLSHPIKIQGVSSLFDADSVHKYLHKNIHDSLDTEQMQYVLERIKPAIKEYLEILHSNPSDAKGQEEKLRGVLNSADATAMSIKGQPERGLALDMVPLTTYELSYYQTIEVKPVVAGCGFSGDYGGEPAFSFEQSSAFSIADYGKDKYGKRTFECPSCKKENVRPYNTLLPRCQHCKSTKVAC